MRLFRRSSIAAATFGGAEGVSERAAAGAQFLDRRNPGWENRVNLDTLNIARADHCALGQVYGGYARGINALQMNSAECRDLGFYTATEGFLGADIAQEYRELTEAWAKEVQDRRVLATA